MRARTFLTYSVFSALSGRAGGTTAVEISVPLKFIAALITPKRLFKGIQRESHGQLLLVKTGSSHIAIKERPVNPSRNLRREIKRRGNAAVTTQQQGIQHVFVITAKYDEIRAKACTRLMISRVWLMLSMVSLIPTMLGTSGPDA